MLENTCNGVFLLRKIATWGLKEVYFWILRDFSKHFFTEHLQLPPNSYHFISASIHFTDHLNKKVLILGFTLTPVWVLITANETLNILLVHSEKRYFEHFIKKQLKNLFVISTLWNTRKYYIQLIEAIVGRYSFWLWIDRLLLVLSQWQKNNVEYNPSTVQKMKFSMKDFLSKCSLVTFTEKILNRELHFLCSVAINKCTAVLYTTKMNFAR